jgi:Acetyltransferases
MERVLLTIYQFVYRLAVSPEICLGLFIDNHPVEGRSTLIGHVVATWSPYAHITDGMMSMPKGWQSLPHYEPVYAEDELIGNDRRGDTVAIHSVAILPEYQGKKIGRALMRLYIHHLQKAPFHTKRAVLIAHDYLVPFMKV